MKPLENAVKQPGLNEGFSILHWWDGTHRHWYQLPTDIVDKILEWRDKEYGTPIQTDTKS